jgi:cyclic pyranopterin phosphate synthase
MAGLSASSNRTERPPLVDSFGRVASDLRVSVTDRCNFRCRYCMPPEGLPWLPKDQLLTYEEIEHLVAVLVECGVRSLKVTGGEPLVRRDVPELVRKLRGLGDDLDISITTNGFLLGKVAAELKDAGLDRVTVSCDSLIKHRFADMTLRDALDEVLEGLRVSAKLGLTPVKINTVVIRGTNEDEAVAFAELARDTGYEVRFIEYMPLDAQDDWSAAGVVPGAEILERVQDAYELVPDTDEQPEPATPFRFVDGAPGRIGIIPSVTQPFCSTCNRLRLTADGQLRACLFALEETDLRGPLRAGVSDDEIARLASSCVAAKWAGHRIGKDDFVKPERSMSMIGG